MNLWKVLVAVLIGSGIAGWFGIFAGAPTAQPPAAGRGEEAAVTNAASSQSAAPEAPSGETLSGETLSRKTPAADATNSGAQATPPELAPSAKRVIAAEQKLAELAVELERFELLINDIEARGEDPADYAESVMPDFRPLMNRFLDAQAELEAALAAARARSE